MKVHSRFGKAFAAAGATLVACAAFAGTASTAADRPCPSATPGHRSGPARIIRRRPAA